MSHAYHRAAQRRPIDTRGTDGVRRLTWTAFSHTFAGQSATVLDGVWHVGQTIACHHGEPDGTHVVPVAVRPFDCVTDSDPSGVCDRRRGGDLGRIFGDA